MSFFDAWNRIGRFIGTHTAFVAPASIIAGILLAPILGSSRAIVPTLFAVMTFQSALSMRFNDVRGIARHPLGSLSVILVVLVVMPLIAFGLANLFFPGAHDVVTGAVIEFSEPIAVMCFIWIGMLDGNIALSLAVILVTSVITPFTMPLTLSLLVGHAVELDSLAIMGDMLYMVAVPSVVGLLINEFSQGWGKRSLAPKLFTVSRIIFVLVLMINATSVAQYLHDFTWTTLAIAIFILGLCMLGFTVGTIVAHFVAPRSVSDRVAIGYTCGMRNISVGVVIAANYFSPAVVFTVIIAVLYQQILAAIYKQVLLRLEKKHLAKSVTEPHHA